MQRRGVTLSAHHYGKEANLGSSWHGLSQMFHGVQSVSSGETVCVVGGQGDGNSLYLLLSFSVTLKMLSK